MRKRMTYWVAAVAAPIVICTVFALMTSPRAAAQSADTTGADNWKTVCDWTAEHQANPNFVCGANGTDTSTAPSKSKKKKKSSSSSSTGPKFPCTSYGAQEQAVALQALQAGHDICQVADHLNAMQPPEYKSLAGDTQCVCYPDGPYVGCREFYMAGPDDGSFTPDNYRSNPNLWFAVSRCDPSCTDPNGCMP